MHPAIQDEAEKLFPFIFLDYEYVLVGNGIRFLAGKQKYFLCKGMDYRKRERSPQAKWILLKNEIALAYFDGWDPTAGENILPSRVQNNFLIFMTALRNHQKRLDISSS